MQKVEGSSPFIRFHLLREGAARGHPPQGRARVAPPRPRPACARAGNTAGISERAWWPWGTLCALVARPHESTE